MKRILFLTVLVFVSILSKNLYAQITGGGNAAPTSVEATPVSGGGNAVNSNVNLFNGVLQSSYVLGTVSTPTGLSYTQSINYNSSYATGDNTPFMSGIPYGEGWSMDVPYITVNIAAKLTHEIGEYEEQDKSATTVPSPKLNFTTAEALEEGNVEFFSPEIHIPGVVSGRLVFKGYGYTNTQGIAREAIFVLQNFSQYIEVFFDSENNWTAVLADGSKYVFKERKYTVLNATNQRFSFETGYNPDEAAINNTREPKKVITTWFVTYIHNPSKHKDYRIAFNYLKTGKFDFHKEQVYLNSFENENLQYQTPSKTEVYSEIFLRNVSAVYVNPQISSHYPNHLDPQQQVYATIELEKMDFIYEEDITIRRPSAIQSLPGMLISGQEGVETHDELYNKTVVYNAKNSYNQLTGLRRYEHVKRDKNNFQNFSETNPYLAFDQQSNQWIYRRFSVPSSTFVSFDHSFLESPKIDIEKTGDMSNMPPGDIYEIYAFLSKTANTQRFYCNFDVNVVSGYTNNDESPNLSSSQVSSYSQTSYNAARSTTLFTTFGNQNKWNMFYSAGNTMTIKSYFYMPNLPAAFGGVFVQIGPANSDNIFNVDRNTIESSTSTYKVRSVTYPHENSSANSHWYNRKTATIPYNFGIGLPWYNEYRALNSIYNVPNSSFFGNINDMFNYWFEDVAGNRPHYPTLTSDDDVQTSLSDLKIYRYSKKPYVLKKVKHYVLKGDGIGGVKSEMYQDGLLELKYAVVQAATYENIVTTEAPSPAASRTEISKRYIITLVQIENAATANAPVNQKTTVDFDYTLTPASTKTRLVQNDGVNFYSYESNGENVVLTRITNPLGGQTFIEYYNLDDDETTVIDLVTNKYRYYPDPRQPWSKVVSGNVVAAIYMGPSSSYSINRAVKALKSETGDNEISVKEYSYETFKSYAEPAIPIYSTSTITDNPSTYKYKTNSLGKVKVGFETATVKYKNAVTNSIEKTEVTKHLYSSTLFGKVNKTSTYSGSGTTSNDLLNDVTFTYESVHAFESGFKRPGYAGLHFDYHDYWETDGVLIPGMPSTSLYPGYVSSYMVRQTYVGSYTELAKLLNVKVNDFEKGITPMTFLESIVNQSIIYTKNPTYLNSYFIKCTKKESKARDLVSAKTTTTVEEYDYFDADYSGKSTSKGYDHILKRVSSTNNPHRLWFVPSWMPYSTTTYNIESPDKKSVSEKFFYYDLKNQYGCFAPGFDQEFPFNKSQLNKNSNSLLSKGVMNFTVNGLAALSYSNYYGIRNILMENRVRGYLTNDPTHIHSTYYIYDVVSDATDFKLDMAPFSFSESVYTPPPPPPTSGPYYPYYPKPGVVVGVSGSADNTNTWGSLDPVQMGYPPSIDPTIVVVKHGGTIIDDWFNNRENPILMHELVKTVYNEPTTSAGEKIHSYLTNLNSQISIPFDEYLYQTNAQDILATLIPNYNMNIPKQFTLGTFMLRGLYIVSDQLNSTSPAVTLGNFLDSVDIDSLNRLVYSSEYPIDPAEVDRENQGEEEPILNNLRNDALRLSKVIVQIDEAITPEFFNLNSGYDYTNLPPILQFEMKSDANAHYNNNKYFEPVFPFKTLTVKKIRRLNYLGGIEEEEDQNGLISKYELFDQQLIYLKTGIELKDIKLITQPFGVIKKSTIGYGRTDASITNYEYYAYGAVKKITYPNDDYVLYQYDANHRLYKTYGDGGKLLTTHKYSCYPVTNLYLYPNTLSNRSTGYSLTGITFENRARQTYNETQTVFDGTSLKGTISRTYVDPLGRAVQTSTQQVTNGASNPVVYGNFSLHSGKVEYNNRTLPEKTFKPFEYALSGTTLNLDIRPYPLGALYQETSYEAAATARPEEMSDFGVALGSGHTITSAYSWLDKNDISGSSELNLSTNERALLMPQFSTKNYIFFKTSVTDQDGKETITYSDPTGTKVATKSYVDGSSPVITLFVHNAKGLLKKVINPLKQESTYAYNILGKLYEEVTPDKGMTRFMYNKSGQVAMMQDANARAGLYNSNIPYYVKSEYDIYGRLKESYRINVKYTDLGISTCGTVCQQLSPLGFPVNTSTVVSYSNFTDNVCYLEKFSSIKTYDWEFKVSSNYYGTCEELIINLGLSYFLDQTSKKYILQNHYHTKPSLTDAHTISQAFSPTYLKGRLTASVAFNNIGEPIQYKYFSYHRDGKLSKELHQFNEKKITSGDEGAITSIEHSYTYTDKLLSKNVYLQDGLDRTSSSLVFNKQYYYTYDNFDRLKDFYFNSTTSGTSGTKIASYEYNNALGFITKTNYFGFNDLGCKNIPVDEITYDRLSDARNRMTKISSKFFDWEMFYDDNAPTTSNTGLATQNLPAASKNHNGNINFTIAKYKLDPTMYSGNGIANAPLTNLFKGITVYGYEYDGLNRLINSDATIGDHVIQNSNMPAALQYGDETYSYDVIGNINNLVRHNNTNVPTTAPSPLSLDMTYNYVSGTNKLDNIAEVNNNRNTIYDYDNNGNLTGDNYRGVNYALYNESNLPHTIVTTSDIVTYLYDESNFRLYKEVDGVSKEYYIKDATGNVVVIVDVMANKVQQWNIEGVAKTKPHPVNGTYELYYYIYDHLSNTRLTYKPEICSCPSPCTPADYKIEHAIDYYPYGKVLREYNPIPYEKEKYLTTGNERDGETGWDYRNARYYDADIARFLAVDPLTAKYPAFSSYLGVNGNPVFFIDPTGKEGEGWIKRENGEIYYDNTIWDQVQLTQVNGNQDIYLGDYVIFDEVGRHVSYLDPNNYGTQVLDQRAYTETAQPEIYQKMVESLANKQPSIGIASAINIASIPFGIMAETFYSKNLNTWLGKDGNLHPIYNNGKLVNGNKTWGGRKNYAEANSKIYGKINTGLGILTMGMTAIDQFNGLTNYSLNRFVYEMGTGAFSAFGGIHGTAWTFGAEIAKLNLIPENSWYAKKVRPAVQEFIIYTGGEEMFKQ